MNNSLAEIDYYLDSVEHTRLDKTAVFTCPFNGTKNAFYLRIKQDGIFKLGSYYCWCCHNEGSWERLKKHLKWTGAL